MILKKAIPSGVAFFYWQKQIYLRLLSTTQINTHYTQWLQSGQWSAATARYGGLVCITRRQETPLVLFKPIAMMPDTEEIEAPEMELLREDYPEDYCQSIQQFYEAWIGSAFSDGTTGSERATAYRHYKKLRQLACRLHCADMKTRDTCCVNPLRQVI